MTKHWFLSVDYRGKIIRGRCSDGRTFSQSFADRAPESLAAGWIAGFTTACGLAGWTVEIVEA